jgi:hypothetical protein
VLTRRIFFGVIILATLLIIVSARPAFSDSAGITSIDIVLSAPTALSSFKVTAKIMTSNLCISLVDHNSTVSGMSILQNYYCYDSNPNGICATAIRSYVIDENYSLPAGSYSVIAKVWVTADANLSSSSYRLAATKTKDFTVTSKSTALLLIGIGFIAVRKAGKYKI